MNESPIISAIIISLIAVLGAQILNIYTYVYWLPYFKFFNIPLQYFNIADLDRYSYLFEIAPKLAITIVILIVIVAIEKRCRFFNRLSFKKSVLLKCSIIIVISLVQMLSIYIRKMYKFYIHDILVYIAFAFMLLLIKQIIELSISYINLKSFSKYIIYIIAFIFISLGLIICVHGYNTTVANVLSGQIKTIDDDKLVLFETSEQYYIIPFENKENGDIKIYKNYYAFINKEDHLVFNTYCNDIYDEYDVKLN